MADKSGIQWTDATWNPTTGCDRVSPGCANCYALTFAPRLKAMRIAQGELRYRERPLPTDPYMRDGDPKTSGVGFALQMHESRLDQPLRWKRGRRIFVNSMSDLFHPEVTDDFLDRVFAVMALAPQHTFQVLTKRPERMREYLTKPGAMERIAWSPPWAPDDLGPRKALPGWPLPNVWLGTSVENARWRTRIDELRETPAAVRFLSCEPLLGSLTDWTKVEVEPRELGRLFFDLTGIDWVIVGGESGPGARPMDEDWVIDILDACQRQGAKAFVKQMGSVWSREHLGHEGHGGDIDTFTPGLRVREWPVPA